MGNKVQILLVAALQAHQAQDLKRAIVLYDKLLNLAPDIPEALNFSAMALYELGQVKEAVHRLKRAIEVNPDYADAINNLGNVFYEADDWDGAFDAYRKVIKIRPNSPEAYFNLAVIFFDREDYDQSAKAAKHAVSMKPDYGQAYALLGKAAFELHDQQEAETAFKNALALDPKDAESIKKLGDLATAVGRLKEASELYKKAATLNPNHVGAHRRIAELAVDEGTIKGALAPLEKITASLTKDTELAFAHFAIGSVKAKTGDHEISFAHYVKANAHKRKTIDYDQPSDLKSMAALTSVLTPEVLSSRETMGSGSGPIFILGMPRSGTTLTEQIISSHSQVMPKGELPYFEQIAQGFRVAGQKPQEFPFNLEGLNSSVLDSLAEIYLEKAEDSPTPYFTDKLPSNFRLLGFIHLVFPDAPIIHCLRDPLDTCISCFSQNFAHGQKFSYNLTELGRYYRAYRDLMNYWQDALPGRFLTLRYEETVADLGGQARRLLNHCGLAWEDRVLEYHKADRPVWTASAGQVQKPIYTESVQRWRRYEKHLGPLIEALGPYADESLAAESPAT